MARKVAKKSRRIRGSVRPKLKHPMYRYKRSAKRRKRK